MKLFPEWVGQTVIVNVRGQWVGELEGGEIAAKVADLLYSRPRAIVLDLSSVEHVLTGALGGIVDAVASAKKAGIDLTLAGVPRNLRRHVKKIGLESVLTMHKTANKAVAVFESDT